MSYKLLLSSKSNSTLVSVIIPMHNSAKFIPQTLESLLYQTMKNFEVVVVDDCSIDNSVEIVESFADRFKKDQLHVLKLSKNSGISSTPRNLGILFAHGKYIAFLDSDDLYTKTALEELTTLAEEHHAEIVHMDDFFTLWGGNGKSVDDPVFTNINELINPENFSKSRNPKFHSDKPILETNDLAKRIKTFVTGDYAGEPYTNFYRRDFLVTNQITFPDVYIFHDQIFAFHGMCFAGKLLRVPNVNYIVRPRKGSIMREKSNTDVEIHKSLRILIDGFRALANILDGIKFFNDHPAYRYDVLNWFVQSKPYLLRDIYKEDNPAELYPLIKKEFSSDEASFAAYLFNTMKVQQFQIEKLQAELRKFQK